MEWKNRKQTSSSAAEENDFSVMYLFDITASPPHFAKIAEPGYVAVEFWRDHPTTSGQDVVKTHSL